MILIFIITTGLMRAVARRRRNTHRLRGRSNVHGLHTFRGCLFPQQALAAPSSTFLPQKRNRPRMAFRRRVARYCSVALRPRLLDMPLSTQRQRGQNCGTLLFYRLSLRVRVCSAQATLRRRLLVCAYVSSQRAIPPLP